MFKKIAARVQLLFCLLNLFFYVLVAVASLDLEVLNVLLCKLMSFLRKKRGLAGPYYTTVDCRHHGSGVFRTELVRLVSKSKPLITVTKQEMKPILTSVTVLVNDWSKA